jgi:hypothetical protein
VMPPEHDADNFTVTASVESFEVNAAGDPLPGVDPAETQIDVVVDVIAVTDPVTLQINGGITHDATIDEDSALDVAALLSASFADLDGSEQREILINNTTGQTIIVNGTVVTTGNDITIVAPGLSTSTTAFPAISITTPQDFSGNLEGIEITLRAEDTDSDNTLGDFPGNPGVETSTVTLNLYVNPVADEPTAPDVSTDEDTAVMFLANVQTTDSQTPDTESITGVTVQDVPADWVIRDQAGTAVFTGDGNTDFALPAGAFGGAEQFRDYTITPPAHSSVDVTLTISVEVTDQQTVNAVAVIDVDTFDLDIDIAVSPVAEVVGVDSDGDGTDDLTINPDHSYVDNGEEDQWFAMHRAEFALADFWANQDTDGSEQTFALFTPIIGISSQGTANGSSIRYHDGVDWVVQTFSGTAIEVPMEFLNTVEFRGAPFQAAVYSIEVQARTVDTNPDDAADVAEAISGLATLSNIFLHPVANQLTLAVTSPAAALEDTPRALNIRPRSDDPSETFIVTISGVPAGSILNYNSAVQIETAPGSGVFEIENFDRNLPLSVQAPLNSNIDFTLTVNVVAVDDFNSVTSISAPVILTIDVPVKGVADPATIVTDEPAFTEEAVDSDAGLVALSAIYTTADLQDDDGSETLTLRLTGLAPMFGIQGAVFLGGTGANRVWVVRGEDIDDTFITVPPNFSGTVDFSGRAITTEDDGDSWTGPETALSFTVTPSPEAVLTSSSILQEDILGRVSFDIEY